MLEEKKVTDEDKESKVTWINIRVKLFDPKYQKPDRIKAVSITCILPLRDILHGLNKIKALVDSGYVIKEMELYHG